MGRAGADGGVSGREPRRLLAAVRPGRAEAPGLLSPAVKMAARGGAAGPEAAVRFQAPLVPLCSVRRPRVGARGWRGAGGGVRARACEGRGWAPRASARGMGAGLRHSAATWGAGTASTWERAALPGGPRAPGKAPHTGGAIPQSTGGPLSPAGPEGGHVVGTIARRNECSQATRVSTGAKRAARALFQTPKNQIKQKKMAPPPKKFEESEEEESSDLEESSGEEVLDLDMESKGCTCYRSIVGVVGCTVTGC